MLKSLCEKGLREFKFFSMIHNVAQAAVTSTGSVQASAARTPPKAKKTNTTSGWSISRILSSGLRAACAIISLGGASPRRSMQPTRDWPNPQEGRARMETSRLPSSTDDFVPAWPCSRRGLPGHAHYCARRWSLTPPFHHHPAQRMGAVCFCGPYPAGSLSAFPSNDGLPRPGCYPTPCSMECGLSSIPSTQDRDCPTNLR
jgi:hypothetical protein